jgi:hypothetical protein
VNRWLTKLLGVGADATVAVGPRPQVIGPQTAITVVPPPRFAWDEKRWRNSIARGETELIGRYRVFDGRRRRWREFDGRVIQNGAGIGAYIADPPAEMRRHRHGACLQLVSAPWFRLHWQRAPKDLDGALLYVERMLDESFNQR